MGRVILSGLFFWVLAAPALGGWEAFAMERNRETSESEYRKTLPLAEQGDAEAQYRLGAMYSLGRGVAEDYTKTLLWWRKAAEQGHIQAQKNIGLLYDEGRDVERDFSEAAKWYEMAAERGDFEAQFTIGLMYYGGKGIQKDTVRAFFWFTLAAFSGTDGTRENRNMVAGKLTPGQIADTEARARNWREKRLVK